MTATAKIDSIGTTSAARPMTASQVVGLKRVACEVAKVKALGKFASFKNATRAVARTYKELEEEAYEAYDAGDPTLLDALIAETDKANVKF
jgi:DNA-binding ferritin-like protein